MSTDEGSRFWSCTREAQCSRGVEAVAPTWSFRLALLNVRGCLPSVAVRLHYLLRLLVRDELLLDPAKALLGEVLDRLVEHERQRRHNRETCD